MGAKTHEDHTPQGNGMSKSLSAYLNILAVNTYSQQAVDLFRPALAQREESHGARICLEMETGVSGTAETTMTTMMMLAPCR